MKRRRPSLRSDCGQEEEEGQSCEKKLGLRKRKSINYLEPENKDDYDDGEEEEEEEEENHNQIPQHKWDKELWPVTCGTKKGMMDAEKLAKSMKCIECEGRQFTPPAFEDFAGKGSSKKWKSTICSDGKPLQYWFDKGLLVTEGFLKKGTKTIKQKKGQTFQNNDESPYNLRQHDSLGDSIVIEESEADFTEDSENEDVSERRSGCKSLAFKREQEKERVEYTNEGNYVNSDHSEGNQDDKLDQEEKEDDGDLLDNPKYPSAPKEPDPRFIISTPEKHALQKKMTVTLQRILMSRSACQTITVEHQPEVEKKRDSDSEINYTEKEKDSEEPVEAEMVDVAKNTSPLRQPVDEEIHESLRHSAAPLSMPGQIKFDNHTDVSSSDLIQSQTISDTRSNHGSDCTHPSDKVETSGSEVLAGSDVDTMSLDQLQRETLKMQLEASRLQKEYYSLKLNRLKEPNTVKSISH